MSKAGDSIRKGLEQSVAYAKGRDAKKGYRVHVPARVHVKAIRMKLGMTQQAFAARFGFSVNTLRHWEQGKREPEGGRRVRTSASSTGLPRLSRGRFASPDGARAAVAVLN